MWSKDPKSRQSGPDGKPLCSPEPGESGFQSQGPLVSKRLAGGGLGHISFLLPLEKFPEDTINEKGYYTN